MDANLLSALRRLDADVVAAEENLRSLRVMREAIAPFFDKYVGAPAVVAETSPDVESPARETRVSPTDAVMGYFGLRAPGEFVTIEQVWKELSTTHPDLERDSVRNAIHYASRKGWLYKGDKRGEFARTNASAPVAAGAEETEEPASGSSLEEGGPENDSEPLRGGGEPALQTQDLHDHAGHRAAIVGGSDLA